MIALLAAKMSACDIILIVACSLIVVGVIASAIVRKVNGKSGCSGDCGCCTGCAHCKSNSTDDLTTK